MNPDPPRQGGRRRSRAASALGVLLGTLVWLAGPAALPASAHATLESSTPAAGATLARPPGIVRLHFNQGVGVNDRSLQVIGPGGKLVGRGTPHHPGDLASVVVLDLPPHLARASYAVIWRVVSADSHVISGSFSFGVGVAPGATAATVPDRDGAVVALDAVARAVGYAGACLLVGGVFFLAVLWPGGATRPRPRRLVAVGWWACMGAGVAVFLLQGAYAAGRGLGDLADPSLAGQTALSRYGALVLARSLVLLLALPVLRRPADPAGRAADPPPGIDLVVVAVAFLVTFSLSEHAGQGALVPLTVTVDAAHLAAACVWIGGLALLAGALLARAHASELAHVLPRWSRVAMICVAVLVVTGAIQAWRETGSLPALTTTVYGWLVLAKVGGLLVLLVLGDQGRRWIARHLSTVTAPGGPPPAPSTSRRTDPWTTPRVLAPVPTGPGSGTGTGTGARATARSGRRVHPGTATATLAVPTCGDGPDDAGARDGGPAPGQLRRLRVSVGAEVAVAAAVLAVTAVLVNTTPARQSYRPRVSAALTARDSQGDTLRLTLDIAPARTGPQTLRVSTRDPGGAIRAFVSAEGTLEERSKRIGPIRFRITPDGPGRGDARVVVPAEGTWTVTIQVDTDAVTDYAASSTYRVP